MCIGMSAISEKQLGEAEKKFVKYEAMIKSMTKEERQNPDLLATSSSRRRRIARGSGHKEGEVGELVAVFLGMRKQAGVLSQRMKMFGGSLFMLDYHKQLSIEQRLPQTFKSFDLR